MVVSSLKNYFTLPAHLFSACKQTVHLGILFYLALLPTHKAITEDNDELGITGTATGQVYSQSPHVWELATILHQENSGWKQVARLLILCYGLWPYLCSLVCILCHAITNYQ